MLAHIVEMELKYFGSTSHLFCCCCCCFGFFFYMCTCVGLGVSVDELGKRK